MGGSIPVARLDHRQGERSGGEALGWLSGEGGVVCAAAAELKNFWKVVDFVPFPHPSLLSCHGDHPDDPIPPSLLCSF